MSDTTLFRFEIRAIRNGTYYVWDTEFHVCSIHTFGEVKALVDLGLLNPFQVFDDTLVSVLKQVTIPNECGGEGPPVIEPPITDSELFELQLVTVTNPELPGFIVSLIKSVMAKGGYILHQLSRTGNGYTLRIEKSGSITLIAIAVAVIAAFALIAIIVREYKIIKLSNNSTQIESRASLSSDLKELDQLLADGVIDDNTYVQARDSMLDLYKEEIKDAPKNILDNITPILWGMVAVSLVAAFRSK